MQSIRLALLAACAAVLLTGCSGPKSPLPHSESDHDEAHETEPPLTNRIPVPESVRRNLGIRFATVEYRHVVSTLRLPGRFEAVPSARREYRTPLAGRVEILVRQYDTVSTGTPLYRLDSPEWRRLQQEMAEAAASVAQTSAAVVLAQASLQGGQRARDVVEGRLIAGERHLAALRESLRMARERVAQLERVRRTVGGMSTELAEARAQVAATLTAITQAEEEQAEVEQQRLQLATGGESAFATTASLLATLQARISEHEAARLRYNLARATARSVLQVDDATLDEPVSPEGPPLWQAVDQIVIHATAAGVVEKLELTSGAYAEPAAPVLSTIDPEAVRFRATALQSDLGLFRDGMRAAILPPRGSTFSHEPELPGTLALALETDPDERTVDVIITPHATARWARAGVTAFAEVVTDESEEAELAIPVAAVVQDDLQKVIFRRDPDDPDQVIRIEADLGISDGHWVTVLSGLGEGDEVVTEGAYQLRLAGSGKLPEGAHVHADGTVHVGEH